MQYLRVFFPSWRFFGSLGSVPKLFYRLSQNANWIQVPTKPPPRKISQILLNPEGNLYLAKLALIDQFLDELNDCTPEQTKTLPILKSLISTETGSQNFEIKVEVDGSEVFRQ
jgi:hypothetical protein